MWDFTPACDGREEEFWFSTEFVSRDPKTWERVMSLLTPDECHTCPLARECSENALKILNKGTLKWILEMKFTWKLQ